MTQNNDAFFFFFFCFITYFKIKINNVFFFFFFAACIITLDVSHCLAIVVPYHYVADGRKYHGQTQHLHSCRNIDALDRVGIAMDRNLGKRIHFVFPQALPELLQFRHSQSTRSSQRRIGVVSQTPSLEREVIRLSWYECSSDVLSWGKETYEVLTSSVMKSWTARWTDINVQLVTGR